MPAGEVLEIGPGTTLRVIAHDEARLEVEASYDGPGPQPPAHLHPGQDEHFELVAGMVRTRIDGQERELHAGEKLDVPAGTVHQMWNPAEEQALLRWTTMPAGRTLEWFRELAAVRAGEPLGDPATLLERYSDTFSLAGG